MGVTKESDTTEQQRQLRKFKHVYHFRLKGRLTKPGNFIGCSRPTSRADWKRVQFLISERKD